MSIIDDATLDHALAGALEAAEAASAIICHYWREGDRKSVV